MKRIILISCLVAASLLGTRGALAQTTPANCFDYYKFGSVQVYVDPVVSHVAPGGVMQFKGTVVNNNPYPIVDGSVYVKVFRNDSKNSRINSYPVVDQFFAKDNFSLAANSTSTIKFNWIVPTKAMSGSYQIATFFQSADEYGLLGLSFTNDIVGNTTDFKVDGAASSGVIISKDDVVVDGQDFMFAAYPPVVNGSSTIAISTVLINTTGKTQDVPVTWTVYRWDGLRKSNQIDQKTQIYTAAPGQTKVSFNVSNNLYPVYYVVAKANYKDSKTILDIRFARDSKADVRLNLPGVNSYPLKKGVPVTLFSCMHAISLNDVSGGKLDLTIIDTSGNTISSVEYNGTVTAGMMAVKKDFVPTQDLTNFTIKASLYQDGVLKDSASMVYDCKNIDPSLCQKATISSSLENNGTGIMWWVIVVLVGLILIIGIVVVLGKRKSSMVALFILLVAGFAHSAEAKTILWTGHNTVPMYSSTNGGYICLLFNALGQNNVGCNNNLGTANVGTALAMQISYKAEVMTSPDGHFYTPITEGQTIDPSDHIRLHFYPRDNKDIFWVGTGSYMASPYGYWVSNAAAYTDTTVPVADDAGTTGPNGKNYMDMSVNFPSKTIPPVDGLSCPQGMNGRDETTGFYEDCTITAPGGSTISPSFNFGATYANFYVSPNSGVKYSNGNSFKVYTQTTPTTSYPKNILLAAATPFQQNIPAQSMTIPFSVATNSVPEPTEPLAGECSAPLYNLASISWGAPSPLPSPAPTYSLEITDVNTGDDLSPADAITDTHYSFDALAGHSYVWDVSSNVGEIASGQVHSSFTCGTPVPTSSLSAMPVSVTSPGSSTLTSNATGVGSCVIDDSAGNEIDPNIDVNNGIVSNHQTDVSGLTEDTTYVLKCVPLGEVELSDKNVTITVKTSCSNGATNSDCTTCPMSQEMIGGTCKDDAQGDCQPWVTDSTGTHVASFAYVGQLVTWSTAKSSYPDGTVFHWSENSDGSSAKDAGQTYPIRYSTIGTKKMYFEFNTYNHVYQCTPIPMGLPVINNPNFQPF